MYGRPTQAMPQYDYSGGGGYLSRMSSGPSSGDLDYSAVKIPQMPAMPIRNQPVDYSIANHNQGGNQGLESLNAFRFGSDEKMQAQLQPLQYQAQLGERQSAIEQKYAMERLKMQMAAKRQEEEARFREMYAGFANQSQQARYNHLLQYGE